MGLRQSEGAPPFRDWGSVAGCKRSNPLGNRGRASRPGGADRSGVTESAVKQFNKRVKGTEQFWNVPGVESILRLRALWLSQDGRWERYWNTRPAYSKAA